LRSARLHSASIVPGIPVQKNGKVKPKDLEWAPAKKVLLGDIDKYIENLKYVKVVVDDSKFPAVNREEIDVFLKLDFFNPEIIKTKSFRQACAVLERARLAILPEGGLHHAAAAFGTAAIVIFGGYISPAQTGYAHHVNLFSGGTPCGRRKRCPHCAEAMGRISAKKVFAEAASLLRVIRLD
jgi:ADP-heptose:LPS heptosyltransferase